MKFYEIEQKYRLEHPARIRRRLRALHARKISGGREYNEIYDREGLLCGKKRVFRLRRFEGRGYLTLKGPRTQTRRYTKRLEIQTPLEFVPAKAILKELGFRIVARYEKRREEYDLLGCVIALDHVARLGWFLEIEGAPERIRNAAAKLGLAPIDMEKRSYLSMLFGPKLFGKG